VITIWWPVGPFEGWSTWGEEFLPGPWWMTGGHENRGSDSFWLEVSL
jgi:hypothetical protein